LFAAAIRTSPADFQVSEHLGWDFTADGEHDYLWLQKTSANTEWVARQLARHAGVPARDVGYAGLKDRHAVTTQWFSVPRWHAPDWSALEVEGVKVLEVQRHNRKLRRGAHKANTFRIVLRGEDIGSNAEALDERLTHIGERGVPNYFGEQRFGRDGGNVELAEAWAKGKRLPRHKRSLAISTIRSLLFNEQLDARVRAATWNTLLPGDKANLDGTGSVFDVDEVDDGLRTRVDAMDIHPAGILAGENSGLGSDAWRAALDKARVEEGWRAFRLVVRDLDWSAEPGAVTVSFSLGRGAFATSVLREICDT
jgi:tRNA pseudouridine13 synthase